MGFRTRLEIPIGAPAFEINRVAREMDASLIIVGTHGESLSKEFLLGSVVHRLLKMAEKPILLIPITILDGFIPTSLTVSMNSTRSTASGWKDSKSGSWSGVQARCTRKWSSVGLAP